MTGGVDTHKDTHVAAALDELGRVLGTEAFPTTPAGYRALLGWLARFGEITAVGVEGTGAWGAGLARFLAAAEVVVVEVTRPNRHTVAATPSPTPSMPSERLEQSCPAMPTAHPKQLRVTSRRSGCSKCV
ncbi:MAG TPA: transposase [Microthrixaceae bacterium]|nr:transposase [Microthrixaceae bacterium]